MSALLSGAHAVVVGSADTGIEGRGAGFELRDTILVVSSGPVTRFAFLFRKPLEEKIIFHQIVTTGTAGINIEESRIPSNGEHVRPFQPTNFARNSFGKQRGFMPTNACGRWPPNLVFVHGLEGQNDDQAGSPPVVPGSRVAR